MNGSGDTSYAWAQLWLYLSIAAIACVVWTILDRKRRNYARLGVLAAHDRALLHRGRGA